MKYLALILALFVPSVSLAGRWSLVPTRYAIENNERTGWGAVLIDSVEGKMWMCDVHLRHSNDRLEFSNCSMSGKYDVPAGFDQLYSGGFSSVRTVSEVRKLGFWQVNGSTGEVSFCAQGAKPKPCISIPRDTAPGPHDPLGMAEGGEEEPAPEK